MTKMDITAKYELRGEVSDLQEFLAEAIELIKQKNLEIIPIQEKYDIYKKVVIDQEDTE